MILALVAIILVVAILPFVFKFVEHQIELFLFVMGVVAAGISGYLHAETLKEIFSNHFLYMITGVVLVVSILFSVLERHIKGFVAFLLKKLPLKLIVFLIVVVLGLLSSIITAIIASLLLIEIVALLPIERKNMIRINIIACFSVGLGAVLTPLGEPLSTIVVSKLHADFGFLMNLLGEYVIGGVLLLGLFSTVFVKNNWRENIDTGKITLIIPEKEDFKAILLRTGKIFLFVVALELLGKGFTPIINNYVIHWSNSLLYWGNTLSAILDNATLAAAEVSDKMTSTQIELILMSLLISGGMMVTGNIPNIITASKLKINMKEWAVFGIPIGIVMLCAFLLLTIFIH